MADSAAGSSAAVLQAHDQREGTRHAAFEFQQELHFPSQQAADTAALEADTQVVLQVLDTLLAAEDSSVSELAQDLQTVVQAAASQVESALTRVPASLTGKQLKSHQTELQNLQSAMFEPLRAVQQAYQQLTQTQAELGQIQGRWYVLQQEHNSLTTLLQGVKDRMQQLAERAEITEPLRQMLVAEVQAASPALQAAGRLQTRCEEALEQLLAVLKALNQTAADWQQMILDSIKLTQTLKHWHQELSLGQHAVLVELVELMATAARQAGQALAPQLEAVSLLSLLAAWQTIFEDTRLIYQALQAEITTQQQIEHSRLLAYAEQMRSASRWHQDFLLRLDMHRAEALQSAA